MSSAYQFVITPEARSPPSHPDPRLKQVGNIKMPGSHHDPSTSFTTVHNSTTNGAMKMTWRSEKSMRSLKCVMHASSPQACFSILSKLSSSNNELFTTKVRIRRHHHHHYTTSDMTTSTTAFMHVRGIVHACRLPASHHHHYLRQQAYDRDVTTTTTITTSTTTTATTSMSMTTMGITSHFIPIT